MKAQYFWTIGATSPDMPNAVTVRDVNGFDSAQCFGPNRVAHAHLISAGPDLLDAARSLVWKLSHNFDQPDYRGPARIDRNDATVRALVAAIERAEGRAS